MGIAMPDIWTLTTSTLIPSIVIGIVAYFGKLAIERRLAKIDARAEEIGTIAHELRGASLGVKTKMREEERQAIVDFRVALERWEDFLHNAPFEFAMSQPDKADVTALYATDRENTLAVKLALAKASIYMRDPALENRLLDSIIKIHQAFYPALNAGLQPIIPLQVQRAELDHKIAMFEKT